MMRKDRIFFEKPLFSPYVCPSAENIKNHGQMPFLRVSAKQNSYLCPPAADFSHEVSF
jgi:hypothetical protein